MRLDLTVVTRYPHRHILTLGVLLLLQVMIKAPAFIDTIGVFPTVGAFILNALRHNPLVLLVPGEYEPGRVYWPTGSLPIYWAMLQYIGHKPTFLLLNAALACTSYWFGWKMSRSWVFATTWALMMGLGTHLTYAFSIPNINVVYIYLIYLQLWFLAASIVVRSPMPNWHARLLYIACTVLLALTWEQWLNLVVFVVVTATGMLVLWFPRHRGEETLVNRGQVIFVAVATVVLMALYLTVRLQYVGEYVRAGSEEELVVAYGGRRFLLMFEDGLSNFFTYLYIAVSNYFPFFMVSSNSLMVYGESTIKAAQNGYHEGFQHLVPMHHIFFWRYYAGAVLALFMVFSWGRVRNCLRDHSLTALLPVVLVLMVLCGFSVHILVKYRPYLSTPALPYKATLSVVGVGLLLAFLLHQARYWLRPRAYIGLVAASWVVLILNGYTRPAMLAEQLSRVGLTGLGVPPGSLQLLQAVRRLLGA